MLPPTHSLACSHTPPRSSGWLGDCVPDRVRRPALRVPPLCPPPRLCLRCGCSRRAVVPRCHVGDVINGLPLQATHPCSLAFWGWMFHYAKVRREQCLCSMYLLSGRELSLSRSDPSSHSQRLYETVFVHRFSHSTMPLLNIFKVCFTVIVTLALSHRISPLPAEQRILLVSTC